MLDVQAIRRDFPILAQTVRGKPLVYLDNAATTQKPRQVLDALERYYTSENANVHRGLHYLSERATEAFEAARRKVADWINAPGPQTVIFTRGTTESINLVAQSWGRANVREGDEILLTVLEHHSDIVPWQLVAQEKGARLVYLDIDDQGELRMDQLDAALNGRTRIVCANHVSNALGTINPVAELARRAHAAGALMLVDGAQAAPHLDVDVQALGCDFYCFSSHKMGGPTGAGVLWGREELLDAMPPFMGGGEMIREVQRDASTWNDLPWKFEAGTPNIAQAIGLGAAVDYLSRIGKAAIREHEGRLVARALERLGELEEVRLWGPRGPRGAVVSFTLDGVHPHDISQVLDQEGVAIRAGHHCAQVLMRRLGQPATARASFWLYNTLEEVETLAGAVKKVIEFFGALR